MIDALYKRHLDRYWDHLGRVVARTGIGPDAVTVIGLGLALANALAFLWHRNLLVFGVLLGLVELLDNLDGAVARATQRCSPAGAFLDAICDRYKEVVTLLCVAQVTGYWAACSIATAGSLLVSYGRARAAMEAPLAPSPGLPPLFERMERVITLCAALVLSPLFSSDLALGHDLLWLMLWILAALTHVTALQRVVQGWRALKRPGIS